MLTTTSQTDGQTDDLHCKTAVKTYDLIIHCVSKNLAT